MMEQIRREAGRMIGALRFPFRSVGGVAQRARAIQLVDGEGLAGEQLVGGELFQHFGFTSALPAGTQLVVVPLGGRTSHAVVVASENVALRFTVDALGEVAVYSQWGDVIHLKQDQTIHVKAATKVLVETPLAEFTTDVLVHGSVTVEGNVDCANTVTGQADCIGAGVSLKNHTHGQVQPGVGHSGKPD